MFIKRLVIIIIAVLVIALGLQALRSFVLLRFIDNVNSLEEIQEPVSADIPDGIEIEDYLIIKDKNSKNSNVLAGQAAKTLDYMKKSYDIADAKDAVDMELYHSCVLIATERLDFLEGLDRYLEYADEGGSLVFLIRPVNDETFKKNHDSLGISHYEAELSRSEGVKLRSDILFGAKGFETDSENIANSSIEVGLSDRCIIHMTSYHDDPLLWEISAGDGRIILFNGTMLNEKVNRGLIAAVLGLALDEIIYPVINSKMLHIDDFPAPIPEGKDPAIFEEFSRSIPQFYKEIWWSDMVKYSQQNDLVYSGFVIENYGDDVTPPFERATDREIENLIVYGKELLRLGGELGLHGYNHQSLALEGYIQQDLGYNSWDSIDDMAEAHEQLIDFIKQVFDDYELRAYVPPSNILSPEGREAIKKSNPDLKIIASVYLPNTEGDVYDQEFSIAEDGIVELPRITSGYHFEDEVMWAIFNGANMPGIFAHFIHPDDILDPERSKGKSWSEMTNEYEKILEIVSNKYGWLRPHTISESSNEVVKFLECDIYPEKLEDRINIYSENFRKSIYCIFKTKKKIVGKEGCDYIKIGDWTYLVTLNAKEATIYLEE